MTLNLGRMAFAAMLFLAPRGFAAPAKHTEVAIDGEKFLVDGLQTYAGRKWEGISIEGRLMNSRMVQGLFDDLNPATRSRWVYPDTGKWDPERNTREFIAAMPEWRRNGLLAFTLNLQGGSPEGYSKAHRGSIRPSRRKACCGRTTRRERRGSSTGRTSWAWW